MNIKTTKRAIVMGATSGIGLEVARLLAQHGWQVGIAGRRRELLVQIRENTPGIVCSRCIDITDEHAPKALETLIEELGGMDLYLHSSGIGWQNPQLDISKEMATVQTNAVGFTRMMDTVFHHFAQQGTGHIAAITSIARTKGLGAAPAYSSTKRFQSHYLECLAQLATLTHHHITVTDIRPGFVATELIRGGKYPLQLSAPQVAQRIVKALERREQVVTIDWRYRLLTALWTLIPRRLWISLRIISK